MRRTLTPFLAINWRVNGEWRKGAVLGFPQDRTFSRQWMVDDVLERQLIDSAELMLPRTLEVDF